MTPRTLLSFVVLGLPFVAVACGGSVRGVGDKSPITTDSGTPGGGCEGVAPGCAGGEPEGSDCSIEAECVDGEWQCNVECPAPPSGCAAGGAIDCATSNDGCTASAQCVAGNWTCVESCDAGPPSGCCPPANEFCSCDAGAPLDTGAPVCLCPEGDPSCACVIDAGPVPVVDSGCECPPNENGCLCATQG